MDNPYVSPNDPPREVQPSPTWYVLFYRNYTPAWWVGLLFIVLSWRGVADDGVGWFGLGLILLLTVGAYVLPSLAGVKGQDHVGLNSRLLRIRGEAYSDVMKRFRNGAYLVYDGVAFGLYPNNEIACSVAAGPGKLDEEAARDVAAHASSVFGELRRDCEEFASAVDGRSLRISVVDGMNDDSTELCHFVDGEIKWR